jgi:hypothetical protein
MQIEERQQRNRSHVMNVACLLQANRRKFGNRKVLAKKGRFAACLDRDRKLRIGRCQKNSLSKDNLESYAQILMFMFRKIQIKSI